MSDEIRHPTNVNEAIELLDDAEFVEWCLKLANKHFLAMLGKKWPEMARKHGQGRN